MICLLTGDGWFSNLGFNRRFVVKSSSMMHDLRNEDSDTQ